MKVGLTIYPKDLKCFFFEVQLLIDLIDGLIKKIIWGELEMDVLSSILIDHLVGGLEHFLLFHNIWE